MRFGLLHRLCLGLLCSSAAGFVLPASARPGDQYSAAGKIESKPKAGLNYIRPNVSQPAGPQGYELSRITSQLGAAADMTLAAGFVFVLDGQAGQIVRLRIGPENTARLRSVFMGGLASPTSVAGAGNFVLAADENGVWQSAGDSAFSAAPSLVLPVRAGLTQGPKPLVYHAQTGQIYIGLNTENGAHIAALHLQTGKRTSIPVRASRIDKLAFVPGAQGLSGLWAGGTIDGKPAIFNVAAPTNILYLPQGSHIRGLYFPPAENTGALWQDHLLIGLDANPAINAPPMLAAAGFQFGQILPNYTELVQMPASGPAAILSHNDGLIFAGAGGDLWRLAQKPERAEAPAQNGSDAPMQTAPATQPVPLPRGSGILRGSAIKDDPLLSKSQANKSKPEADPKP